METYQRSSPRNESTPLTRGTPEGQSASIQPSGAPRRYSSGHELGFFWSSMPIPVVAQTVIATGAVTQQRRFPLALVYHRIANRFANNQMHLYLRLAPQQTASRGQFGWFDFVANQHFT